MIKRLTALNNQSWAFSAGLVLFFLMNSFTALNLGIHYDEAYYWLYSQHPAFGYFDHPPMISWLIHVGYGLFPGIVGLRILIILLSTASAAIIWQLVKPYGKNPVLFWTLMYSILLIHPYSIIATPDAPLIFFSVLFLYAYRRFLIKQNGGNILFLALTTALMFYSKYHAILMLGFTILSNIKLLKKKAFWVVAGLFILFMLPHFSWQYQHHFDSFQYQLLDSHRTPYSPMVTISYIINQLLVTGPWLGWLFLYFLYTAKPTDQWEKAVQWTAGGTFLFFLLTTFSGDYEPHWTLIAMYPMLIIVYRKAINEQKWQRWIILSGIINFILLLIVRIILLTPLAQHIGALKTFSGWDKDSQTLRKELKHYPVLFQDTWNRAARFAFYTDDGSVTGINSGIYRRNQYNIWKQYDRIVGDTVAVVSIDSTQFKNPTILKTNKATWYIKIFPDFHSYYSLKIRLLKQHNNGDQTLFHIQITNPYPEAVKLTTSDSVQFQLYRRYNGWQLINDWPLASLSIPAGGSKIVTISFPTRQIPQSPEGWIMLKTGLLKPLPDRIKINQTTETE